MDNRLLKAALLTNAGFSGVTGIGTLAWAGSLEQSLGPPAWSLRALGAGLLAFALIVARETRSQGGSRTWAIISADVAWVVAATIIIAVGPVWMTGNGRAVLAAVTFAVAALATAQWRGLADANRSTQTG